MGRHNKMSELQTPAEGTEQEPVTQTTEQETPQTPTDEAVVPQAEPTPETPSPEPQPETEPYKEKFVASQRESILNHARVEAAESRIAQLTKTDTPNDEPMQLLYPEAHQVDEYHTR